MRILRGKTETVYAWKNVHLNRSRLFLFFVLLALAFLLFVMNIFPTASMGIVLIPVAYALGIYTYKKLLLWESGTKGQRRVTHELKKLGDDYYLVNSIVVPPNRGDTDHIVFCRRGIFVIETKTLTGNVKCDGDSWTRFKIGRGGGTYGIRMGSPSNQVKRNAKVLKDFILKHKREIFSRRTPHIWIHGIVVFAEDVALELTKPTVDVLKLNELNGFIKGQGSAVFHTKELENLGEVILKHC